MQELWENNSLTSIEKWDAPFPNQKTSAAFMVRGSKAREPATSWHQIWDILALIIWLLRARGQMEYHQYHRRCTRS